MSGCLLGITATGAARILAQPLNRHPDADQVGDQGGEQAEESSLGIPQEVLGNWAEIRIGDGEGVCSGLW